MIYKPILIAKENNDIHRSAKDDSLTRPEITTLKRPKQESSLGMLSIIAG